MTAPSEDQYDVTDPVTEPSTDPLLEDIVPEDPTDPAEAEEAVEAFDPPVGMKLFMSALYCSTVTLSSFIAENSIMKMMLREGILFLVIVAMYTL